MAERIEHAITGLGVVAPAGIGPEAYWQGLLGPAERDGIYFTIPDYDAAAELEGVCDPKELRSTRMDPYAVNAMVAANQALNQSQLLGGNHHLDRIGVSIGTGDGGASTKERIIAQQHDKEDMRTTPFYIPMVMGNSAAAHVSIAFELGGPCHAATVACATGAISIIEGLLALESPRLPVDAMLVGSSEATQNTPVASSGFRNMTAFSTTDESFPFDQRRNGFVLGEGAGVLVAESPQKARSRGVPVLATIVGFASVADHHHISKPNSENTNLERAVRNALETAELDPSDIGAVFAHGTSTPDNGRTEAETIAKVFGTGDSAPLVTSSKGVQGHSLGGSAALDAVAATLSIVHGEINPIVGYEQRDPKLPNINIVQGGERAQWDSKSKYAIQLSNAFGGHIAALVLGPGDR